MNPSTIKITREIKIEGTVVKDKYLICEIKSLPAIAGARLVVSDKGDILSPKYAPLKIAPATKPSEISSALPIPINAIPIVAEVVHELPVAIETTIQMTQAANKNILAFKI